MMGNRRNRSADLEDGAMSTSMGNLEIAPVSAREVLTSTRS